MQRGRRWNRSFRGVKPGNNRQVISGILHVLKFGCRWRDCPAMYGPPTTIYNRFNRWSKAGVWQEMLDRLVQFDKPDAQSIDSTTSKAHPCSAGGKGGPDPGDWTQSRRTLDQNPCRCRQLRAADRIRAHPG
jgi:transposase